MTIDRDEDVEVDDDEATDVREGLLSLNKTNLAGNDSGKGGFFSSAFTIFNSTVGTGILTLPYSFSMAGAGLGLFLLIFYAVVMGTSAYAVVRCAARMHCKTFQDVVRKILGDKAGIAMSVTISFYCFLACVGCLVIVADVSKPMLDHWSGDSGSGSDSYPWWDNRKICIVFGGLLALPPMMLRDFTSLTFTALLSFGAILYVVSVIVAEGYDKLDGHIGNASDDFVYPPDHAQGAVDWVPKDYKLLYAIPNIALSLQCHIQSPGIFSELPQVHRTPQYFSKVLLFSYSLCIMVYSTCAFFGYVTFREHTPPNIMSGGYDETNPAIIIARISLVIVATCALPINHHPCRAALRDMYIRWSAKGDPYVSEEEDEEHDPDQYGIQPDVRQRSVMSSSVASHVYESQLLPRDSFYYGELVIAWVSMVLLAMVVPDLSVLNDIIGFTAGVSVMFIFPGLFLLTMQAADDRLLATHPLIYRAIGYFYVSFGFITGVIAAFSCFDSIAG